MKKVWLDGRSVNFKKKVVPLMLMLVLLLGLIMGCSSGDNDSAAKKENGTVNLKLAHFFPSVHPAETELIQPWAKAVEEATGGKVQITSYPGEMLLKANDVYEGVVDGIADIGLSCFSYTRGRFPVLEVFELPGVIYNNSKAASQVAWEGIQELNPKEVQDTKLLMV